MKHIVPVYKNSDHLEDLIRFMVSYKDDYLPTSRGFDTYYGKPMVACTGFTSLLIFGVVV
jgi:endoglucanase Acf2